MARGPCRRWVSRRSATIRGPLRGSATRAGRGRPRRTDGRGRRRRGVGRLRAAPRAARRAARRARSQAAARRPNRGRSRRPDDARRVRHPDRRLRPQRVAAQPVDRRRLRGAARPAACRRRPSACRRRPGPASKRWPRSPCAPPSRNSWSAKGWSASFARSSCRSSRCWRGWRPSGSRSTDEALAVLDREFGEVITRLETGDLGRRRARVQPRQPQAARTDPVRRARTSRRASGRRRATRPTHPCWRTCAGRIR